jgi:hypothetical protein
LTSPRPKDPQKKQGLLLSNIDLKLRQEVLFFSGLLLNGSDEGRE